MGINREKRGEKEEGGRNREERKKSEGLALLPTEHAKDQCRSAAFAFCFYCHSFCSSPTEYFLFDCC